MPNACQTAFKEWAVTIEALARGEQIIILRKGGIQEPNLHFQIEHDRFLFFPGYLHQDAELLKLDYRSWLTNKEDQPDPSEVTFSLYAEVTDVIELGVTASGSPEEAEAAAAALEPFHIWAPGFALKRVHWKPLHPLNAIFLRCYSIQEPVTMPVTPQYSGCTSWVDLDSHVSLGEMTPVMQDADYEQRASEIKAALAATHATT
jgi:hypothetical protein|tara:strand:+ start:150 stop:761 length:612 start_codon:yes stop_codon:yes gene_type:complete